MKTWQLFFSLNYKTLFMKRNNIFLFIAIALFFTLINGSCSKSNNSNTGGTAGGPVGGTGNSISIAGMAFSPSSLSVKVGATVTWKNNDGFTHTVTSDDGASFDSGNLPAGGSFSYKTTTVGTFDYHCTIHSGMTGTLVVTQ